MAPPSKLSISTSSVLRLVKEEASYHKEQQQQEARIKKLESSKDDENAEFVLQQERRGLEETKAIFPSLKLRITDALAKLEAQLESSKADGTSSAEEISKAEGAITDAKKVVADIA